MSEEERKIKQREYQTKYRHSEKGRKSTKSYKNSERARLLAHRYANSEKGKKAQKNYTRSPLGRYTEHKNRAKRRSIEWLFTPETWWEIWEPHWERRGQGSNDLQMCRYGDEGPYSPDNVRIDTSANNAKEKWEIRRRRP